MNRRGFLQLGTKTGLAAATMPLWMRLAGVNAYAQSTSSYKAIVCITLHGGNDGNNIIVPLDSANYQQYATLRQALAIPQGSLLPVQIAGNSASYGFHPSLPHLQSIFNNGLGSIVANCGPMDQPLTKQALQENPSLLPSQFGSHPAALAQWESATTQAQPPTGWGGRIADEILGSSGLLPPVLSVSGVSTFTVGSTAQSVSIMQTALGGLPLPADYMQPTENIAGIDASSNNELIQRAAQLRNSSLQLQTILVQSQQVGSTIQTVFPTSQLGQNLKAIAEIINGRSVIQASRQLFYSSIGNYDTHGNQMQVHASLLSDLDSSLGAFVTALQEIGMLQNVLIVTVSDFGRTMQSNSTAGSDHAWGNQQFIIGGGFPGQRIIGTLPALDIGGSQDWTGQGVWIPTIASQQVTGGVASWFGLNATQIANIFPNLAPFANSPISL